MLIWAIVIALFILPSLYLIFVMFPDSLGSGDDDEDNGLEDSSAEIENDQVYFSRGVFSCLLSSWNPWGISTTLPEYSDQWLIGWSLSIQVPTGPTPNEWRRSYMLFLQATQWSFVVQPWAAPCQASAGSKMVVNLEESIASGASRWAVCYLPISQ